MDKNLELEEKKQSRLQWLLFVILIPLMAAAIFSIVILKVAGVNVGNAAKAIGQKIPGVSKVFEEEKKPSIELYQKKISGLEESLKQEKTKITQLENIIDSRDKELNNKEIDQQRLQQEVEELTKVQEENKRAFKDIIQTYQTMSPGKAAPILSELSEEESVKILSNISSEALAAILEKMEPAAAARLTQKLTVNVKKQETSSE
ncbi:flagellar motility protein MotE (MotC chaperone) [Peribacillus deserti]|uniref:Flagellar motility protein MotE (MotC chaperone) n=1 Tax=Peribacillus deserti TaxID=673318 RepID=A0ABS2QGI8_9BACI|nr:hypothetical protein [Peribacillus deserti]MBM7692263.1 flagellar motility protein MotE (MotC chaperone) [Peribacillus deserti]